MIIPFPKTLDKPPVPVFFLRRKGTALAEGIRHFPGDFIVYPVEPLQQGSDIFRICHLYHPDGISAQHLHHRRQFLFLINSACQNAQHVLKNRDDIQPSRPCSGSNLAPMIGAVNKSGIGQGRNAFRQMTQLYMGSDILPFCLLYTSDAADDR